jgi:hypothetical protein
VADGGPGLALAHLDAVQRLITGPDLARLTRAGATAGKQAAQAVGDRLGPLRHMGRGVKLRARYDMTGDGRTIVIALRPPGAWVIAQSGARVHEIKPRRRRTKGTTPGRGAPAVLTPNGPRAIVYGAHARGRNGIAAAFARARPAIPQAIHDAQVDAMRAIFG